MNKTDINDVINIIDEKYPDLNYSELITAWHQRSHDRRHQSIIEQSQKHDYLVGKCFKKRVKPHSGMFPEMWRYYKVISYQSSDQYRVECLEFDEHPTYWFDHQSSALGMPGDYYLGSFDFYGFWTEDVMANELLDTVGNRSMTVMLDGKEITLPQRDKYTAITLEEYNNAMMNYTQELSELPWYAEHYRLGGKLPTDEGWETRRIYDVEK